MTACYVNQEAYFYPAAKLIYSISKTNPAIVTTTNEHEVVGGVLVAVPDDHGYSSGLIVRIEIPEACGMQQLNGFAGEITVTGATTFAIAADTTNYDDFVIPLAPNPAWAETCAQVIPFGENSLQLNNATINTLP
jgi:hypothetical protein